MQLPALLICVSTLAAAFPAHNGPQEDLHRRESNSLFERMFDYVIVGGGTAGLTMANRLSADPDVSVAVIEAGSFYQLTNPIIGQTPVGDALFAGADPSDTNPFVDWNFVTEPQDGAGKRRVHYARGKCLGGSSARNFMIYQRGTKQTYEKWADLVGDESYSWDALQPHFKKSVSFSEPSESRFANATAMYSKAAFSPSGGPLSVSYPNYAQPFSTWLEPALHEAGVPLTEDFNSGALLGAQYTATTIDPDTQTRESSQTSFLQESRNRLNLRIYSNTMAKKIVFDSDKRATGVIVKSDGMTFTLKARNEVILSAGAFQSPQMLMVSGVGPRAELERFDIPVIADRPGVGQGMEDHVFFGPTWRVNVPTVTKVANDLLFVGSEFVGHYSFDKDGPLANNIADFLAWEKLPRDMLTPEARRVLDAEYPADWPDMEYLSAAGYVGDFSNLLTMQPKDGYQYATILGALVAPRSRGTVTLQSADTDDLPLIDPKWLTDPTDVSAALATYKRLRQVFATKSMSEVLIDATEYFPGPKVQTDAEILRVIRDTVMTVWHASCTCRMGKVSDKTAVVDKDAKVIGVKGLRVVDASSFAMLPPGHPQSTVYMLAEKISAEILAHH